ncbi:MAG: L-seryl-tRNA(Sec) selenium transferase [Pseudomonadota bacterium]
MRKIPSVDRLLNSPELAESSSRYSRSLVHRAIEEVLGEIRAEILSGDPSSENDDLKMENIQGRILQKLAVMGRSSLRPVINATGVVIHTNLGRSILAERVIRKFRALSGGYSNLEYDLDQGKRGSRYSHVEGILREITSAEGAMVVNNNAAAVLITLETLAKDREVIVSRGQLVEIGGSFRIPDVMRKSGAKMVEVGTTNKTRPADYEEKIGPETALLLKVHTSNFKIVGFTEEVETADLVKLGKKYGIPVVEDLGSGCLLDLSRYGIAGEPTVQETLSAGVDLVTFSGDKLLGGPQAGIILGRANLVDAIKKNQIARALRIDKLTLLALEETLNIYRDERAALREIPTLKMMTTPYNGIRKKARRLFKMLGKPGTRNFRLGQVDGSSMVGGGALPLLALPSRLICLIPETLTAQRMERWLRAYSPSIIVRVEKDQVILDLRTVLERELKTVAQALKTLSEIS